MTTLLADVGGTRLKTGLLEAGDRPPRTVHTADHHGSWRSALQEAVARDGADDVALAVPGLVEDGRVVALPDKLPGIVGADLSEAVGVPVRLVVNDAIAFGIGEAVHGAGVGARRVLAVTLGTGVGVAVVEDGRPLGSGPLGGGLLGGSLPLGDGQTIEQACCAAAFVERTGAHPSTGWLDVSGPGLDEYRTDLARALTVLVLAHAPDVVVVGGGVAQASDLLLGVEDVVRSGLWPGQTVEVRLAHRLKAAALDGLAALLRSPVPA